MPHFFYQALGSQGKKTTHSIEATSLSDAKERLRKQNVMVISLKPHKKRGLQAPQLQGISLLTFTTQLAALLKASLPLYESLSSLEEQYAGEKFHPILSVLCERIKGGVSLSKALQEFPSSFSTQYVALIEAAETVGALDISLESLAVSMQKTQNLQKSLVTASLYPLILLSFSLVVIGALLSFVVPSIETMLEGRPSSYVTSFVIGASHFFTRGWPYYFPFLASAVAFLGFSWKKPSFRTRLLKKILALPFLGTLLLEVSLARFFRTFGSLLNGGVNLTKSLNLARKTLNHPLLEEIMDAAEKKILEGSHLSRELKKSPLIPQLVRRLVQVGEETGKMQQMSLKIASLYEESVEKKVARLLAILQPALLLVLGVIVGIIMLGVLLPLTDFQAFTGG